MSKNKILAGLLSLAMAASLAPMSVLAAESDEGTLIYMEDFENYTTGTFDLSETTQARGFWKNEVADDGNGGHYMKYYADLEATLSDGTTGYNQSKDSAVFNSTIFDSTDEINKDGWYEIGYVFYPGDMKTYMSQCFLVTLNGQSYMSIGMENGGWLNYRWIVGSTRYTLVDANDILAGVQGGVNVKIITNPGTGATRIYTDYKKANGTPVSKVNTGTAAKKAINSGSFGFSVVCNQNPATKNANNPKPYMAIDNYYVKKLPEYEVYTVTFDSQGGSAVEPLTTNYFGNITMPANPTKGTWVFNGWFTDQSYTTQFTGKDITKNMTVYAKWTKKSTVTFNSNGGTEIDPIVTETGEITLPSAPTKSGWAFDGWYTDEELTNPFNEKDIQDDMTVYAKWTEYLYREDFENYNSGLFNISNSITSKGYWHNEVAEDGHGGYYMKYYVTPYDKEGNKITGQTGTIINPTIVANTKDLNKDGWYEIGYTYYPGNFKAHMGSLFEVNVAGKKTRFGYERYNWLYYSWYAGSRPNILVQNDVLNETVDNVKIRMVTNPGTGTTRVYYTVNKKDGTSTENHADGGIGANADLSSGTVSLVMSCSGLPESTASYNSYALDYDPYMAVDDIYVKALPFESAYTVTFDTRGGNEIDPVNTDYFGNIALPTPTKENFRFVGWFTENDEAFTGKNITSDVTVYAKWSGTYNVTFNANGGLFADASETKSIDVDSETTAEIQETPAREGYTFCGWFTDQSCVTEFTGTVYENTTVYARWQTTPEIVSVTPASGSAGVELNPEIILTFSSEMDNTTLTKDNIKVIKDGVEISESLYSISASLNAQRMTVVRLTFNTALEASKEYTVKVLKAVKNQHSTLADDFTASFTTKALKLNVTVNSVKSGNETVTDLSAVKGQKIKVTLKLTNAAGVGYTTIYSFRNGNALVSAQSPENIATDETVESELTVPENAESLDLIVLDSLSALKPLTEKTSIIEK